MSSKKALVEHIDAHRGRGLVAKADFNEGDSILLAPYDIAVLYSPFVRNTCYRCFEPVVELRKEEDAEAAANTEGEVNKEEMCYECSSCKHLALCSSCVKDLVAEACGLSGGAVPAASLRDNGREGAMLHTHPLLEAHKLACAWFCTLPDSVRAGDTDYLRFALQYGSREVLGDTRLLLAVKKLCTNTVQQFTETHRFCESFAKLVVETFAPQGYRVDMEHLRDVLLRTKSNSIGYPFNEETTLGWSLQEEFCMINHSCVPNAAVVRPKRTTTAGACSMELVARRPIKAGEEITIAYVDVESYTSDVKTRRRHLMEGYGFLCRCPKCEPDTAPAAPTTAHE
ncbi:histone-lysine N-methyltransferase ASHR2 [Trypanosoma rangeli]|uniref:Histone-lysine N-methyltransferase ASHR2 n=1 Tax=Trypanosoma rangeli TaxID=5698 RepID=A0A3S5IRB9_TRYRA|nr:histone-lysine N-methyltransferase ASHR2 [Trypanosoma rangeli]RNF05761.1 histone-lysine N-methyltransferase ASHR2 [Trypanosoma rangeli]|eukprot:RNF05761.1 histone-lysine N-methyltransferase ASHR2 [Trypanosoma rangeli]